MAGESATARSRANPDLPALAAAVVLINLPYLSPHFVPPHDAGAVFGLFSYFYNNLLAAHELPLWMCYGTYGIPSGVHQVDFLTAPSYFFMAVGAVFQVRDPKAIFVLSVVGEQLLFVLGVYLLSRRLFADRLTTLIVGFGAVFGVVCYWQIFMNFRIHHLIPLALYFLLRFTEEKRPEFLWMTGVTLWLDGLGSPPYVYPMVALAVGAFAVALGAPFWRAFASLRERSWRNGAAFGAFVLTAVAVALLLHGALDGAQIVSVDRDSDSGKVDLATYLSYGGTTGPGILASFLGILPRVSGGLDHELNHYIGILPLVGLIPAALRCRNRYFLALVVMAAVMFLISLGGTFACLAYRLPVMSYFRHVGYMTTFSKVALLLAGGFGIEELLAAFSSGLRWDRRTRFGALAALGALLWILLDAQIGGQPLGTLVKHGRMPSRADVLGLLTAVARTVLYASAAALLLWPARSGGTASAFAGPTLRRILLAVALMDGLIYQSSVLRCMPFAEDPPPQMPAGVMTYRERRGEPLDPRLEKFIQERRDLALYGTAYQIGFCTMYQLDPSTTLGREDWLARPVAQLRNAASPKLQRALQTLLGVTAPKLRLVGQAVHVGSEHEAIRVFAGRESMESVVVLRGAPPELRGAGSEDRTPGGSVRVREFSANRLVADVMLPPGGPAWLVYADAFHPGWRATVNGQPAPVVEANLVSKAVRVPEGTSTVCLTFNGGARSFGGYLLAAVSVLFAVGAFAGLALVSLGRAAP
jgi:hypothetical protein